MDRACEWEASALRDFAASGTLRPSPLCRILNSPASLQTSPLWGQPESEYVSECV